VVILSTVDAVPVYTPVRPGKFVDRHEIAWTVRIRKALSTLPPYTTRVRPGFDTGANRDDNRSHAMTV